MAILDDLRAEQGDASNLQCRVGRFLRGLDDDLRAEWEEALDLSSGIQHTLISKRIRESGIKVGADGVRRHRNGECTCGH